MKKITALLLALVLLFALTACGKTTAKASAADGMSLEDILASLLETSEFEASSFYQSYAVTEADAGNVNGSDGSTLKFKEALGYGPMIGSIPFSMAIFRAESAEAAETLAASLKDTANPGKWICVCADVVETAVSGSTVLFIMSDADTATAFTTAFAAIG